MPKRGKRYMQAKSEIDTERVYHPLFRAVLRRPRTAVALSLMPILVCGVCLRFLGGEFMPKLEEGNLWIRATFPTSISLDRSASYVGRMRDMSLMPSK